MQINSQDTIVQIHRTAKNRIVLSQAIPPCNKKKHLLYGQKPDLTYGMEEVQGCYIYFINVGRLYKSNISQLRIS